MQRPYKKPKNSYNLEIKDINPLTDNQSVPLKTIKKIKTYYYMEWQVQVKHSVLYI